MNFQIFKVQKEAGFRINLVDILFIMLLIGASIFIHKEIGYLDNIYLLSLYVGFTFFLFCNVFRLTTKYELIWTLIFALVTAISFHFFYENWVLLTIGVSSFVQLVEIVLHLRSDAYRGVFSR